MLSWNRAADWLRPALVSRVPLHFMCFVTYNVIANPELRYQVVYTAFHNYRTYGGPIGDMSTAT